MKLVLPLTATAFALTLCVALAATSPVQTKPVQTETLSKVTFATPEGGHTTKRFAKVVRVHIRGTGHSFAGEYNDAFYIYADANHTPIPPFNLLEAGFYQLAFSTTRLAAWDQGNAAVNSIVGGLPPYSPTHEYTFLLKTGVTIPTSLHFGVTDGEFSDNTGSYRITITSVPEPGTRSPSATALSRRQRP